MRREEKRSMKDRILAKAKQPRGGRFSYLNIPEGFESFTLGGKTKDIAGKKISTKRIDIMPYIVGKGNPNCEEGELYYERTFFIHNVDTGEKRIKFVCPKRTAGKPCPACEMEAKLRRDPNATKDEINNWASKERQLFNVIDMDDPDQRKIWDVSYPSFGKILDACIAGEDEDEDLESFAELKGGKTLRIQSEEKKFGKGVYFEIQKIDFKDRQEDYENEVLDNSACLDDLLVIQDYAELNRILFDSNDSEVVDVNVDEEEEEEKKPVKRTAKKQEKPVKQEDEDEDEDEDDEEEEEEKPVKKASKKQEKPVKEEQEDEGEEEEEKPGKKSKASKKKDEDEDEDDEEDDAEEEKPAKKSSKKQEKPVKEEEEEDEEDDEEEEKPAKKSSKSAKGDSKCPFGHKWAIDCDSDECCEDCIDCDKWDECSEAQEKLNK